MSISEKIQPRSSKSHRTFVLLIFLCEILQVVKTNFPHSQPQGKLIVGISFYKKNLIILIVEVVFLAELFTK